MPLERTAVPRELSSPRRFTRRFGVVVMLGAFAALSGPVGCVAAFANRPVEVVPVREARHGAVAAVVAESYLAGREVPVPVAGGLTPAAGRDPVERPGEPPSREVPEPRAIPHAWIVPMAAGVAVLPGGEGPDRVVETHPFLVGTGAGVLVLTVPIVEAGGGAPALGAAPSLEPYVPDAVAGDLPGLDWSATLATERPGAALRERVAEWAQAYAGDDRRRLLEITGDSRNGATYVGLGGWEVVGEPRVGGVVTRDDGLSACQVELALASAVDGAVTARVAFDLLLADASGPLPSIVAWGPAGTALSLEPHAGASPTGEPVPGSPAATAPPAGAPPGSSGPAAPGEGGA
ncbi:MAG TPA: hypothetical protein VFZ77_21665 [Acidimicrobiales bacterium]